MADYIEETQLDSLNLKRKDSKIKVKCFYCGKLFDRWLANAKKNIKNYGHIICPSCMCKRTNSKIDYKARAEKTKQTAIKKYGSAEAMYALRNAKSEKTCKEKYGVKFSAQADAVKEKIKETSMKRYGVENPGCSKQALDKMKKHFIEKYGVDNPWKSKDVINKIKETNLKKYGAEYYTQTDEYQQKSKKRYTYEGITFHSSWELAYYIYCKDHNINISRSVSYISYKDSSGKTHRYFPDFIVNGQIVEIKGTQFYTDDSLDGGIYKSDVCKCKLQLLKDLNIKVISDCSEYLSYIETTYGKDFLQKWRNR